MSANECKYLDGEIWLYPKIEKLCDDLWEEIKYKLCKHQQTYKRIRGSG